MPASISTYLQREGVTREGLPGDLYDANEGPDRHQFRFIVSPEDAIDYPDPKILGDA